MQSTVTRTARRVLYTRDGRHSGCVLEQGILKRRVQASRHQLRQPPAWAFELGILEAAHEAGASLVEVHDVENGITYTAPLATLWQKGIRIRRGCGEQIALPLNLWHREDPKQGRLF
ncbi:MAG: hypothetical protein KatS3mg023_1987 [Armatimonadota bacterium]|nr:MAG: hypothetical protein KatS3mg023_1987 [Armatimonadota bacterium]